MSLKKYRAMRNFKSTPEPQGGDQPPDSSLQFVIQKHRATRLHFDFRLAMGGTFKSWAVPKGPSFNPTDQRLAVYVEDHPLEYGGFEGIIPPGNYGAGTVMIWDCGYYSRRVQEPGKGEIELLLEDLNRGRITILMSGVRLRGEFALVRTGESKNWLLIKKRDDWAVYRDQDLDDRSVVTGRTMDEIAVQAEASGEIWLPGQGPFSEAALKTLDPKVVHPSTLKKVLSVDRPKADHAPTGPIEKEVFPRSLRPMVGVAVQKPFDEKGWMFLPLFGGIRCLGIVDSGVQLLGKTGRSLGQKFPDVVKSLRQSTQSMVLDGELIYRGDGTISRREGPGLKAVFRVFDLLHLDGMNLRLAPLADRFESLKKLDGFWSSSVERCEVVLDESISHREAWAEVGAKSILGRNLTFKYVQGVNPHWQEASLNKNSVGPSFSNLGKIYFPELGITKGQVIEYYEEVSDILLPHIQTRPQNLHRFPGGIHGESFYHKDMVGYLPNYIETIAIESGRGRTINYMICRNVESLQYMVNLGCIEINPWLSEASSIEEPDLCAIDLDPDGHSFGDVVKIARTVHEILQAAGIPHGIKTSGATGIHIMVKLAPGATYEASRSLAEACCQLVHQRHPELTSLERQVGRRRGKIYLDYMQNRRGSTLACIYSLRPRPLGTVSTPLEPHELMDDLKAEDFSIKNVCQRFKKVGDLWGWMVDDPGVEAAKTLANLKGLG